MRFRDDRGAAAVEFALVMPLLVILICAVIDFGRAYNAHITLTQAVREGVRVLALTQDGEAAAVRTRAMAYGLEDPSTTANEVTVLSAAGCTFGQVAELEASFDYDYVTPVSELIAFISSGSSLTSPITIEAKAGMRCGG